MILGPLETYLSHIVEISPTHWCRQVFLFCIPPPPWKKTVFCRGMWFFRFRQTEISPIPAEERFMSLRMKFLSACDPEGRFLKVEWSIVPWRKDSSSRGLLLSSSLHLFYRHFKSFWWRTPKPVEVPHFPLPPRLSTYQSHCLISSPLLSGAPVRLFLPSHFVLLASSHITARLNLATFLLWFLMVMQWRVTERNRGFWTRFRTETLGLCGYTAQLLGPPMHLC